MGDQTGIEWADKTWSPWTGCQAVSEACAFCYAEELDTRYGKASRWGPHGKRARTSEDYWRRLGQWDRSAAVNGVRPKVFASMCDPFDNHASIDPQWRADHWAQIRATPHLIHLLLTKRPQNIVRMLPADWGDGWPNVWLGTTVENQEEAERRIPNLLRVPARVHFLSCEPLLGPVDLRNIAIGNGVLLDALTGFHGCKLTLPNWQSVPDGALADMPTLPKQTGYVSWVISGGESGTRARPSAPSWFRALRDQCVTVFCTAFFHKQNGEFIPAASLGEATHAVRVCDGTVVNFAGRSWTPERLAEAGDRWELVSRVGKKRAGNLLDGVQYLAFPRPLSAHDGSGHA